MLSLTTNVPQLVATRLVYFVDVLPSEPLTCCSRLWSWTVQTRSCWFSELHAGSATSATASSAGRAKRRSSSGVHPVA
ncbi:hypothetical protein GS584_25570 [Rhodococcus hoagii]|nr:hypothetical protein [Prescottella equi]